MMMNYIDSLVNNRIIGIKPPGINPIEETLPRGTRRTLAQLRTNKSPLLNSYLNKINPKTNPSPNYPLCKNKTHDTKHLFTCTNIKTNLGPLVLWYEPVAVAELLQQ